MIMTDKNQFDIRTGYNVYADRSPSRLRSQNAEISAVIDNEVQLVFKLSWS